MNIQKRFGKFLFWGGTIGVILIHIMLLVSGIPMTSEQVKIHSIINIILPSLAVIGGLLMNKENTINKKNKKSI